MSLAEAKPIETQETGELFDLAQAVMIETERLFDQGENISYGLVRGRAIPYQCGQISLCQQSDIFQTSTADSHVIEPISIPTDEQANSDEWFDQRLFDGQKYSDYVVYEKDSADPPGGIFPLSPEHTEGFRDARDDRWHLPEDDDYVEARRSYLNWVASNLKDKSSISVNTAYRSIDAFLPQPIGPDMRFQAVTKVNVLRDGKPASADPTNYYAVLLYSQPDPETRAYKMVWVDADNYKAYAQTHGELGSHRATAEELDQAVTLIRSAKTSQ